MLSRSCEWFLYRGVTIRRKNSGGPYKQRVCLHVRIIKKRMGILKSVNVVDLYRVMSMLKLKINVILLQLLRMVVSAAQTWRIWAIWWVLRWLLKLLVIRRRLGWKAHFRPLQRQADFHPEVRISLLQGATVTQSVPRWLHAQSKFTFIVQRKRIQVSAFFFFLFYYQ